MAQSLPEFIAHARKKGMDHQTIRMLLLSSGWKEKDIAQAMTEESLDMPVPMPPDSGGARDAFFHLLTFASFYTTAISLVSLFFTYINRLFPDAAFQQYGYNTNYDLSGIRWSIAALIVAFPIFLGLSRFLLNEMRMNPEKAWTGVRRWLTYLTLFIAAAALMGDFITLVYMLLEGEITIRFILKVLVVLLVAGGTFYYYFVSLRIAHNQPKASTFHRSFAIGATVVVLIAIIWGIWLTGSPLSERERKFDERRVEQLRAISNEIRSITLGKNISRPTDEIELERPLPQTLQEVVDNAVYQKPVITDPETGAAFEYSVQDATHYQLCAVFNAIRDEQFDIFWNHPAGRHCFDVDVLDMTR
jgi:hypothetical protein